MGIGERVKGAHCSGHEMGKGAKDTGKDPAIGGYVEMNKQIILAAEDKTQFLWLLELLSTKRVNLSIVNVVTILHRGAKLRLTLPDHIVRFLRETLNEEHCLQNFKAQDIGTALYGLQRLGDSKEVRQLIVALTPKVQRCQDELKSQEVGNALYGLQRLGDSKETRQLVAALTPKVQQCREELNSQAVGNALYGLQRMGDLHEVLQLLAALTATVQQCRDICARGPSEVSSLPHCG